MEFICGDLHIERKQIIQYSFSLFAFFLIFQVCASEKFRYATADECDRHSLDALFHEKFKPITNNIFSDVREFMSRVLDLTADSLTTIMASLPDRDASDNRERALYSRFKTIKSTMASKVKKIQKNITSSWEDLLTSHFDLMYDNGKSSLQDYLNKTVRMIDSYSEARKSLDSVLSGFVGFVKATVRDGLGGITAASAEAIKKEEEERKKNETEEVKDDSKKENEKNKEEILHEKKLEIAKMIVSGFLGNVTVKAIERKMDLNKETGTKPEDRDSVLDDMVFDMFMVKNRMRAIIQTDVPRDKGAVDLARRSIYTYWADSADEMYKEKIKAKKSGDNSLTGRLYYRNLWKDEEQLVETLLDLMEVYP